MRVKVVREDIQQHMTAMMLKITLRRKHYSLAFEAGFVLLLYVEGFITVGIQKLLNALLTIPSQINRDYCEIDVVVTLRGLSPQGKQTLFYIK